MILLSMGWLLLEMLVFIGSVYCSLLVHGFRIIFPTACRPCPFYNRSHTNKANGPRWMVDAHDSLS